MGFFDKLKKNNTHDEPINTSAYKKVLRLIDDKNIVADSLVFCIENPMEYFNDNIEAYEERGIDESEDLNTVIWLGLVDGFIEKELMCELDYKDELEEFIACVKSLIGEKDLSINIDWFDENSEITNWAEILNEKWKETGYVLAAMYIESDSYCIFIIDNNSFEELKLMAKNTGHRVDTL